MRLAQWFVVGMSATVVACTGLLGDFTLTTSPEDAGSKDGTTADVANNGGNDAGGDATISTTPDASDGSTDAQVEAAIDANVDAGPCGHLSEPCCSGTCDDSTLACAAGFCRPKAAGDTGTPCTLAGNCQSGICLPVGQPVGGGPGWTGSVCTQACASDNACVNGWKCSPQSGVAFTICKCAYASETCDSADNDCDGTIDNEPAVDNACKQSTRNPLYSCKAGTCTCGGTTCNGACVDTTTNTQYCGSCTNACATGQSCNNNHCECPQGQDVCNGACLDTTSDPKNCGGCGAACTVSGQTCKGKVCGCPQGNSICSNTCVDTTSDSLNCFQCGNNCGPTANCQNSQCTCNPGLTSCNGNCLDLNGDPTCGTTCGSLAQCTGGEHCKNGACQCLGTTTLCNGNCVDFAGDPKNCGACGHDCGGGNCANGQCQAVTLCTAAVPSLSAARMTVGDSTLVWTGYAQVAQGYVMTCPLATIGAAASLLYSGQNGIGGVATFKNAIAWADENSGTVNLGTTAGDPATLLAGSQSNPVGVATDGINWYWGGSGTLARGTSSATPWITGTSQLWDVAVDAAFVFGADVNNNRIVACSTSGTGCGASPIIIATGVTQPRTVFSDGKNIWFGTQGANSDGSVYKCPIDGCKPTNAPTPFAATQGFIQALRADATNVYFFSNAGLVSCPVAGCGANGPKVLVPNIGANAIAIDANYIYYAAGNVVNRLAK